MFLVASDYMYSFARRLCVRICPPSLRDLRGLPLATFAELQGLLSRCADASTGKLLTLSRERWDEARRGAAGSWHQSLFAVPGIACCELHP